MKRLYDDGKDELKGNKNDKKKAIKIVGTALNDNELKQVTGGIGYRRTFCSCFVPMPDGNGYCEQCGFEIFE